MTVQEARAAVAPVGAPATAIGDEEAEPEGHERVLSCYARSLGRDWRLLGLVVLTLAAAVAGLYGLQALAWDGSAPASGWQALVALAGGILWCCPVMSGSLSCIGMLFQRRDRDEPVSERLANVVSFRYMSRGTNPASLRSSIESVHAVMGGLPLFDYVIEVCVELPQPDLPAGTVEMVIPADYRTPNNTLYKGRALQFAMEQSALPDDGWILHCDEESHIHPSLVYGIYHALREEEASGQHRIGQGAILYYNSLDEHPFLTLADSVRTGDDVGRFHLQNRCWGTPVWGFHGSFILVRNSVEREVGFDFGPAGSITEDAFWALVQTEHGRRSRWVDGYMIEQGTERIVDFVKQRRRWYVGLVKVVRHAPTKLRWRLPLALFTMLWSVSWLAIIYTYVNYIVGWHTAGLVQAIGNTSLAAFVCIYVVGLRTNLKLYKPGPWRALRLYLAQIICIPAFAALEAAGVAYALLKPETGFHVVQKKATSTHRSPAQSTHEPAVADAGNADQPNDTRQGRLRPPEPELALDAASS